MSDVSSLIEEINQGAKPDTQGSETNTQEQGGSPGNAEANEASQSAATEVQPGSATPSEEQKPEEQGQAEEANWRRSTFDETQASPEKQEGKPSETKESKTTPSETEQGVIFNQLSEMTGGAIQNADDLSNALDTINQYQNLIQNPPEPKFPNERAREIYNMIVGNENGVDTAQAEFFREAQIMTVDPDRMDPREVQFQGWLLSDEARTVPAEQRKEYFDLLMEEKYGDALEDLNDPENKRAKLKFDVATNQAKEAILNAKQDFLSKRQGAKPSPQQVEAEKRVNQDIENYFSSIKGFDFDFNPEGSDEALNVFHESLADVDRERYIRMAKDPSLLIQEKFNQFYNEENNQFDIEGFSQWVYAADNVFSLMTKLQNFGYGLGNAAKVKALNNAPSKATNQNAQASPEEVESKGGFVGAFREALKGKNMLQ